MSLGAGAVQDVRQRRVMDDVVAAGSAGQLQQAHGVRDGAAFQGLQADRKYKRAGLAMLTPGAGKTIFALYVAATLKQMRDQALLMVGLAPGRGGVS